MVNTFACGVLLVSVGTNQYQENPLRFENSPFCTQSALNFTDHTKPLPFLSEVVIEIRMLSLWKKEFFPNSLRQHNVNILGRSTL